MNFNRHVLYFFLILNILIALQGCITLEPTPTKKNFAFLYNPASTSIHPNYLVFHKNDMISTLMISINSSELLFNEANPLVTPQAELKIFYKLFNDSTRMLEDSATINLNIRRSSAGEELVSFIPLKARFGNSYTLQIETTDMKRKSSHRSAIKVDKTNRLNRQNYLIRDFPSTAPVFNYYSDTSRMFYIEYPHEKIDSLNVKYYNVTFSAATPPSTTFSITDRFDTPDSLFSIRLKDTSYLRLNQKGFYIFQVDLSKNQGIGISCFYEGYPKIAHADVLLEALVYVAGEAEYKNLSRIPNKKLAVDSFWLKTSNDNAELARELIRVYYNRAYLANLYFTSYKEGWKTDRGMIYMIYGLPDYVFRSDNTERWVYNDKETGEEFFFKFQKTFHPYTDNHYTLVRSENLNTHWREAIAAWRSGKIYSSDE